MDWPNLRTGSANIPQTIPERDFNKIMRRSRTGSTPTTLSAPAAEVVPDLYTGSVGWPGLQRRVHHVHACIGVHAAPHTLVATADRRGLYGPPATTAGGDRLADRCRHPGNSKEGAINTVFADGHRGAIGGRVPYGLRAARTVRTRWSDENTRRNRRFYANPVKAVGAVMRIEPSDLTALR